MTRLRRLDSVIVNKVIIAIHVIQFGKVISIAFSDGSVEYRERSTMQEVYTEPSLERVMTLHQVGYTYADDAPCESHLCSYLTLETRVLTYLQACKLPFHRQTAPLRD